MEQNPTPTEPQPAPVIDPNTPPVEPQPAPSDGFSNAQDALQSVLAELRDRDPKLKEDVLEAARARRGDYAPRPTQPAQPAVDPFAAPEKTLMEMTKSEAEAFLRETLVAPIQNTYDTQKTEEVVAQEQSFVNVRLFGGGRKAGFTDQEIQTTIEEVLQTYRINIDVPGGATQAGKIVAQSLENKLLRKRLATPANTIPAQPTAPAPGAVPAGGVAPAAPAETERAKAERESIERMKNAAGSNTARILAT